MIHKIWFNASHSSCAARNQDLTVNRSLLLCGPSSNLDGGPPRVRLTWQSTDDREARGVIQPSLCVMLFWGWIGNLEMRSLSGGEPACSSASRALVREWAPENGSEGLTSWKTTQRYLSGRFLSNRVEEVQLHWPLVAPVGCERGTRVVWNPFKCAEFTVVHRVLTVLQVFNDPWDGLLSRGAHCTLHGDTKEDKTRAWDSATIHGHAPWVWRHRL